MSEGPNKLWYIHTEELYSAIKWHERWIHPTTGIYLQGIILREKSQSRRVKYSVIPFIQSLDMTKL